MARSVVIATRSAIIGSLQWTEMKQVEDTRARTCKSGECSPPRGADSFRWRCSQVFETSRLRNSRPLGAWGRGSMSMSCCFLSVKRWTAVRTFCTSVSRDTGFRIQSHSPSGGSL